MPNVIVLKEFNKYKPGETVELPNELIGENQIEELSNSGHILAEPTKEAEEKAKLEAKQADEAAKLEAKHAEEKAALEKKQAEEAATLETKQAKEAKAEEKKTDEGVPAVYEEEADAKKNKK